MFKTLFMLLFVVLALVSCGDPNRAVRMDIVHVQNSLAKLHSDYESLTSINEIRSEDITTVDTFLFKTPPNKRQAFSEDLKENDIDYPARDPYIPKSLVAVTWVDKDKKPHISVMEKPKMEELVSAPLLSVVSANPGS